MSTIRYVAYGSNLLPARLRARIPVLDTLGVIELPGRTIDFSKRSRDGSGKCNLAPADGACAYGVVYVIAERDRVALDRIEGLGRGYTDCWLDHADYGRCYFYTATPGFIDARLSPYDWYKAFVLDGARHHGLPADYVESIDAFPAIPDPDEGRRRENLSVRLALGEPGAGRA